MEYSLLGPTGVKLSRICLGMAPSALRRMRRNWATASRLRRSGRLRTPGAHRERLDATPCNDQQASKRLVRLRARPSQRDAHFGPIWAQRHQHVGTNPLIPDTR